MAHGAYLKILYKAWNDSPHVLTIYKEDFTGSESERTGVDAPTIIDFGDGSAEEIGVIQGSRLKCGFYTEDGDDYSEFSNANKRQYYAVLTTGLYGSNRDIWRGWIVPEQRNEPLTPNQPIYLTFIDGLGELKNIKFSDNGTAYTGRKSWLEILTIVLNKLETNLPIVEDILFKGSGLTGNTLQLNYTDVEIFEGETCSKVITNILAGCTIRQAFTSVQDVFWLIRSNDKIQYIAATEAPATSTTLSYALPKYLYDGTPSGTVTVDYYIKVDDTDLEHESTPHFSDWPAWSELNFTQKLIRNDNLLDDSGGETPSNWTWVNATEKYYNLPNGRNALRMPGVGYYQLGLDANEPDLSTCKYAHQTSTEVIENSAARLKLTFNWNLHALGDTITNVHQGFAWYTVHLFDPDTTDKYAAVLTNDAETGEKYLAFDPLVSLHAIPLSYEYDDDDGTFTPQMIEASKGSEASKLNQFEIIIRGIPFTGVLIVTLYFYQRGIVLEISHSGPVNIASESLTMLWDNIQFQLVDEENKQFEEERGYTLVNPNQYVNNGPDIELLHGTLPDEDNRGSIWISGITTSDSGLVLIDEYESTAFAGTYKYAEMIARIKMGLHLTPALTVQTNMFFHDTVIPYPFVLIYDPNSITSKWLQFNSYSLDYYNGELQNVLMVAVNEFDASSTLIEQTVERSESSGGNSGAPTYGHNPLTLTEDSPDVLDGENQILDLAAILYWQEVTANQEYSLSTQYATIETRSIYTDGGLRLTHESDAVNDWKILSQVNVATIENISFRYSDSEMFSFSNTGTFNAVAGYQLNGTDLILDFLYDTTVNANIDKIPQITATGVISWVDLPSVGGSLTANYIPYWDGSDFQDSIARMSGNEMWLYSNTSRQLRVHGYGNGVVSNYAGEIQIGTNVSGDNRGELVISANGSGISTFYTKKTGGSTIFADGGYSQNDVLKINSTMSYFYYDLTINGQLYLASKLTIPDSTQQQLLLYGYSSVYGAALANSGELQLGLGSGGQKTLISYDTINGLSFKVYSAKPITFFTDLYSNDWRFRIDTDGTIHATADATTSDGLPRWGQIIFKSDTNGATYTGNVGIGGASDASYKLKVFGDIYASDNIESELYRLSGYDLSLNALRSDQLGTAGQVLTMSGGVPVWGDATGGSLWTEDVYGIYYNETNKAVRIGNTSASAGAAFYIVGYSVDTYTMVVENTVSGQGALKIDSDGFAIDATGVTAATAPFKFTQLGEGQGCVIKNNSSSLETLKLYNYSTGNILSINNSFAQVGYINNSGGMYLASAIGIGTTTYLGSVELAVAGDGFFSGYLGIGTTPTSSYYLKIGTVATIDTSGNADFNSLLIGSTTAIDSNGYIKPVSSADSSAPNNSIYYSSDQSKLVYKDSGGTVNNLY